MTVILPYGLDDARFSSVLCRIAMKADVLVERGLCPLWP